MTTHITKTLRKIGEDLAEEYAINWEYWDSPNQTENIEKEIEEDIIKYERKIDNFFDIDDLNCEQQYIINNLVSAYTIQSIIERKNKIDEVIKNSM
jgi:hypothetical protein